MRSRTPPGSRRTVRRALACVVACLLVAAPVSASAQTEGLTIQSVDAGDYPSVRMLLTLPVELLEGDETPEFEVRENGVAAEVIHAERIGGERDPIDVLLLIDTSGSMEGKPLHDAGVAATRFLEAMDEEDRIAIMSFSSSPRLVTAFTRDRGVLRSGIDSLDAAGETALYDALGAALEVVGGRGTEHQSIILLSDGGDTVSSTTLDAAAKALAGGPPVLAVTLPTDEADPEALEVLAAQSGGRVLPVSESAELAGLYAGLAEELQTQYRVTYASAEPRTMDLEIEIVARAGDEEALASVLITNPRYADIAADGAEEPLVPEVVRFQPTYLAAAVAFAFLAIALLTTGVLLLVLRKPVALDQVRFYDQLQRSGRPSVGETEAESLRRRVVETVGYVAGRRGFTEVIGRKLESAGLPLRPAEYMTFHVLSVVVLGFLTQLLVSNVVLSLSVVVIASLAPVFLLDHLGQRRTRAFEEQLPDILNLISGSLRAGWGILQSVDLVVKEMLEPASSEFRRVEAEARLGLPVEEAFEKMAYRLGSEDFKWTVTAINVQREVGGNLAEVLDIVADTIRERGALRRHVRALTAEGRYSGAILIALPFVEGAILLVVNPAYMSRIYSTGVGLGMLGVGAVLLLIGAVWLRAAVKVEI